MSKISVINRMYGNMSVNVLPPPYLLKGKELTAARNLMFDYEKGRLVRPKQRLVTAVPTSTAVFQPGPDSGSLVIAAPPALSPVFTPSSTYSIPDCCAVTGLLCPVTAPGTLFGIQSTLSPEGIVSYQGTFSGNELVRNTPDGTTYGPGTDYPVGLNIPQLNWLISGGPLVVSADIDYVTTSGSDVQDYLLDLSAVSMGWPSYINCPPTPQTSTVTDANGTVFTISVFGGDVWCYLGADGLYYPYLNINAGFPNGAQMNTSTSTNGTSIFPKYWQNNWTLFGVSVPVFEDEPSEYDLVYGCDGDNGTYEITTATGTLNIDVP